jgi:hypothetical protein
VPVIPPEDNILLKALWGRGPEVGKHDWEDVREMMDARQFFAPALPAARQSHDAYADGARAVGQH